MKTLIEVVSVLEVSLLVHMVSACVISGHCCQALSLELARWSRVAG